jgi:hypothetical protein
MRMVTPYQWSLVQGLHPTFWLRLVLTLAVACFEQAAHRSQFLFARLSSEPVPLQKHIQAAWLQQTCN